MLQTLAVKSIRDDDADQEGFLGFFSSSTLGMIWVTMKASDGQTALIESSQQLKSKVVWVVR
jgi:hypothetical protein